MRVSIVLVLACAVISGCITDGPDAEEIAQFSIESAQTPRGVSNVNNIRLGYLYIWNREQNLLSRIEVIKASEDEIFSPDDGFDISVSLERGARFDGGLSLSQVEVAALEAEVSSRASFESKNLLPKVIKSPITALANAMNQQPDRYISSMDFRNIVETDGQSLYVIASEISYSDSTQFKLDDKDAVGGSFQFNAVKPGLKFVVSNAGAININGVNGQPAPTFVRFTIVEPYWGANNNAHFKTRSDIDLNEAWGTVKLGAQ
ncbi:MAG: hypothetical protein AAGA97_00540 [Pseudomonadota bacterium]